MMSLAKVLVFMLILNTRLRVTRSCIPATNVTCPRLCECTLCGKALYLNVYCWNVKSASMLNDTVQLMPLETDTVGIGWNKLSQIFNRTFLRLSNLTRLFVDHSKLDGNLIQLGAFHGLNKLTHLNMGNNPRPGIIQLHSEWLKPLPLLSILSFEYSNLNYIPEDVFANNSKLYLIKLYNNNLKSIAASTFHNLPELERLFLQHNSLTSLPADMFNGTREVKELNIAHNQLTTISPDTGLQNLASLYKLHVYGNPLDCGCDLIWFRNWIDTTDVVWNINNVNCSDGKNILKFNPERLQCGFPVLITVMSTLSVVILCTGIVLVILNRWQLRYGIFLCRRACRREYAEIERCNDEFEYDVFLSHSSKDVDWVTNVLRPTLENPPYNYKLCLDYRDFIVGDTIADNIIDAVQKSRKTAFILTKSFIESEWCYFELEMVRQQMFDEHRDLAILIMKENVSTGDMPGLLKYLMRKGNYIEWSENKYGNKLFWNKLDNALNYNKENMV
ncbi:toll-like receptor 2 [Saccoglossus kowalevskii]|uniref:Toll-like receptor 13-like n=1 Tax=Saccoglossus kowalevskii TaxID=10224 RepID=A0ABM0H117_SACKO|nr:PREDICTED: toll-like receptor 13-like [Saccoglossus kowalevskii]